MHEREAKRNERISRVVANRICDLNLNPFQRLGRKRNLEFGELLKMTTKAG